MATISPEALSPHLRPVEPRTGDRRQPGPGGRHQRQLGSVRPGRALGRRRPARPTWPSRANWPVITGRPAYAGSRPGRQQASHAIWHQFYNSPYQFVAIQQLAKWFHPTLFTDLDPRPPFASCTSASCRYLRAGLLREPANPRDQATSVPSARLVVLRKRLILWRPRPCCLWAVSCLTWPWARRSYSLREVLGALFSPDNAARAGARGDVGYPPACRPDGGRRGRGVIPGRRADADHPRQPAGQPVHPGHFRRRQFRRRHGPGVRRGAVPAGGAVHGAGRTRSSWPCSAPC